MFLQRVMAVVCLAIGSWVFANDQPEDFQFHYLEVTPQLQGADLLIQFKARSLFSGSVVNDYFLDRALRESVQTIARMEQTFEWTLPNVPMLSHRFKVRIELPDGTHIWEKTRTVELGLAPQSSGITFGVPKGHKQTMPLAEVMGDEGYARFYEAVMGSFRLPAKLVRKHPGCIVTVHGRTPIRLEKKIGKWPTTWSTLRVDYPFRLGSSYWEWNGFGFDDHQSLHLVKMREVVNTLNDGYRLVNQGKLTQAQPLVEWAFQRVPSMRSTARSLLFMHQSRGQTQPLLDLNAGFQPFFLHFYPKDEEQPKIKQWRKDPKAWVQITSPAAGDLIAGPTKVKFVVKDNDMKALRVDCLLDGEVVDSITQYPVQFRFTPKHHGEHKLTVAAYFEDGTVAYQTIPISSMAVDASEEVNLVRLQVVATRMRKPVTDLSAEDFTIVENGKKHKIASFKKLESPINVGVLLDTSNSMQRGNMLRAISATDVLLNQLREEERVAIYSFDSKVQRIKAYAESNEKFRPTLYTLHPQLGTSMRDALMVARGDLQHNQKEINALILLTDGRDTDSRINEEEIAGLMENAPIRLYTFSLDAGYDRVAKRMAKRSGGYLQMVRDEDALPEIFNRVLEEVRNLYEISYYSSVPEGKERNLNVKLSKGSARWLNLN